VSHLVDVDLVPEGVGVLVGRLEPLVLLRRQVVVALQVDVAADAQVLDAHQVPHVVVVIDQVLHGRRLL
jgi:hypothetical protein